MSQNSGAFASSQAPAVRKDSAASDNVDFTGMNKDILKEWRRHKSNNSGSSSSSSSSNAQRASSSRKAKDMEAFVERTNDELEDRQSKLHEEIEEMQPNSRASEQLEATKERHAAATVELTEARLASRQAMKKFNEVKKKRLDTFMSMYNHVKESIGEVYTEMTELDSSISGEATLELEDDNDEPYLSGIKYNTLVPGKRFRDMDQLSGGEKVRYSFSFFLFFSLFGIVFDRETLLTFFLFVYFLNNF